MHPPEAAQKGIINPKYDNHEKTNQSESLRIISNLREASNFRDLVTSLRSTSESKTTSDMPHKYENLSSPTASRSPGRAHASILVNEKELLIDGVRIRFAHPTSWNHINPPPINRVEQRSRGPVPDSFLDNSQFQVSVRTFSRDPIPDSARVLTSEEHFVTRGLHGLNALLKSYEGASGLIDPSDVSFMSRLLSTDQPAHYNYNPFALFALRYPLEKTWDVSRDSHGNRIYINLLTGQTQHVHPYLSSFRQLLIALNRRNSHFGEPVLKSTDWLWFSAKELSQEWLQYMTSKSSDNTSAAGYFYNMKTGQVTLDNRVVDSHRNTIFQRRLAAIKIQSFVRGYLTRKNCLKRLKSAVTIQSCWRMVKVQRAVAHDLENKLQGWRGEKYWRDFDKKLISCVSRIQALIRGWLFRHQHRRLLTSCRTIEAIWLGIITRKRIRLQFLSIVKIQKNFRGYLSRQYLKSCHRAGIVIQSQIRGILVRKFFSIIIRACVKIQSRIRGISCRKKLRYQNVCAVLIQSIWRRYESVKRFSTRLSCIRQELRNELKVIVDEKLSSVAALTIQSFVRGCLARKFFAKMISEKNELNDTISCATSLFVVALCSVRDPIHPWRDYLNDSERLVLRQFLRKIELGCWGTIFGIMEEWFGGNSAKWIFRDISHLLVATTTVSGEMEKIFVRIHASNPSLGRSTIMSSVLTNARNILNEPNIDLSSRLAVVGFGLSRTEQLIKRVSRDLGEGIVFPIIEWSKNLWRLDCMSVVDTMHQFVASGGHADRQRARRRPQRVTRVSITNFQIIGIVKKFLKQNGERSLDTIIEPIAGESKRFELFVVILHAILHHCLQLELRKKAAIRIQIWFRNIMVCRMRNVQRRVASCRIIQRCWRRYWERRQQRVELGTGASWVDKPCGEIEKPMESVDIREVVDEVLEYESDQEETPIVLDGILKPSAEHVACLRLYLICSYNVLRRKIAFKVFSRLIEAYEKFYIQFATRLSEDPKLYVELVSISEAYRERVAIKRKSSRMRRSPAAVPSTPPIMAKTSYYLNYMRFMEGDDSLFNDLEDGVPEIVWSSPPGQEESLDLIWVPIRTNKYSFARLKLLRDEKIYRKICRLEQVGDLTGCFDVLLGQSMTSFNLELVFLVGMGYVAQCVRDLDGPKGAELVDRMIRCLRTHLDGALHLETYHKTLIRAMVLETGLGFAYAFPNLVRELEFSSWFSEASKTYEHKHVGRFIRCCVRYACLLIRVGQHKFAVEVLVHALEKTESFNGYMRIIAQLDTCVAYNNCGDIVKAQSIMNNIGSNIILPPRLLEAKVAIENRINHV